MEQYSVTGMSCAACSARVEKAVSKVPGGHILLRKPFDQLHGSGRDGIGTGNYYSSGKGRIWGEQKRKREKDGRQGIASKEDTLKKVHRKRSGQ